MTGFPTKQELRLGGISLVASQILILTAWSLQSLEYDIYNVKNEQDVVLLHNALSAPAYKLRTQLAMSIIWISFPLLLIGLMGLKKYSLAWYESTPGETYIYIFEKAYIIWMSNILVLPPALGLVAVSYDWTFDEPADNESVPSAYYIQLFIISFQFEVFDCLAIADAVFMLSIFILDFVRIYGIGFGADINQQFNDTHVMNLTSNTFIAKGISCCCVITLFILFSIILFEFADSGFFSITGYSKFCAVLVYLCKTYLGIKLIYTSTDNKYFAVKRVYDQMQKSKQVLSNDDNNYQMEHIAISTEINNT